MPSEMLLPDDQQHLFIIGMNGSGKTQAGVWHLSMRSWDQKPWVIFDFKRDQLLADVVPAKEIPLLTVPDKPGLYVYRPDIMADNWYDQVNETLKMIWAHEDIGIYIDEGFQIRRAETLQALLMQGRSKNIPLIVLFQRPLGIKKELRTESQFYQIFFLANSDDRKEIQSNMSDGAKYFLDRRIPIYHSIWYEQSTGEGRILKPVPDQAAIARTFRHRLAAMENRQMATDGRPYMVV